MPFASPLVDRLDHVLIEVDDPTWIFDLFSRQLGLPVAWPLKETASRLSGGVRLGGTDLAFVRFKGLRFGQAPGRPVAPPGTARLTGLALAPARALPDVLEAMQRRGLSTGFVDETEEGTLATVPGLLSPPEVLYFLSRGRDRGNPPEAPGGVLGLEGRFEIAVNSPWPEAWARLLMPTQPGEGDRYPLGGGGAIALQPAETAGLISLALEVASLARARAALEGLGLLGEATPEGLTLRPDRLGGLSLSLRGPA